MLIAVDSSLIPAAVAFLAVALSVGYVVHALRTADLRPDDNSGDPFYDGPVYVRVRRTGSPFVDLKGGVGPLRLIVSGHQIKIRSPLFPRRVAVVLSLDQTLKASALTMRRAEVGWSSTPILRRDSIVLRTSATRHAKEFAVNPRDGDLERLRVSLALAGVRSDEVLGAHS
jgi:hypothetical protein